MRRDSTPKLATKRHKKHKKESLVSSVLFCG
jgi:hypothetical protein